MWLKTVVRVSGVLLSNSELWLSAMKFGPGGPQIIGPCPSAGKRSIDGLYLIVSGSSLLPISRNLQRKLSNSAYVYVLVLLTLILRGFWLVLLLG